MSEAEKTAASRMELILSVKRNFAGSSPADAVFVILGHRIAVIRGIGVKASASVFQTEGMGSIPVCRSI